MIPSQKFPSKESLSPELLVQWEAYCAKHHCIDREFVSLLRELFSSDALFLELLQNITAANLQHTIMLSRDIVRYLKKYKSDDWLALKLIDRAFYGEDEHAEDTAYAFERYQGLYGRWVIPSKALETFSCMMAYFTRMSDFYHEWDKNVFYCQLDFAADQEEFKRIYNSYGMEYDPSFQTLSR